ncbi:hypothetical protein phytr_3700 [Candidatus Phycorickettsia trachydisci]|uniref:NADH-quinone oxidoreductase subunit C n=1 Tax=Candidatus Phycorickettsia trachydisci TaxID=2115978 RepID=A0A2P1P7T0_9RICK|nr:NADH-quinone oxidoreductase subunit C [Candidatus Phycorickettsia trachydisci]AVP87321.1 hypothetical protein phytr_3700 [Candidatus Phycorickettsia trachydisci]
MKEEVLNFVKNLDPECIQQTAEFITLITKKDLITKILSELKQDHNFRFTVLTDLFVADFPSRPKRFEVVYNLLSLKLNMRLIIKVQLKDKESMPSATSIFSAANWYEREAFDLFGIIFDEHPNLTRILTDYGFEGHPLRKDFPLSGYNQVKYDEKQESVIYEPLDLEQEFRSFDFASPWQGPDNVLPGDEKASFKPEPSKK